MTFAIRESVVGGFARAYIASEKLQNRNRVRNKMADTQICPANLEIRWMAHTTGAGRRDFSMSP